MTLDGVTIHHALIHQSAWDALSAGAAQYQGPVDGLFQRLFGASTIAEEIYDRPRRPARRRGSPVLRGGGEARRDASGVEVLRAAIDEADRRVAEREEEARQEEQRYRRAAGSRMITALLSLDRAASVTCDA